MLKACKSLILLLTCALSMPLALADQLLRSDHPDHYTVVKGDTLWDISGRFLQSPWRWPEIWHVNPQVANPHLIYPGDQLDLVYIDGKPQLRLRRGPLKLSPTARSTPWDGAIPSVPLDAIAPFLTPPMSWKRISSMACRTSWISTMNTSWAAPARRPTCAASNRPNR